MESDLATLDYLGGQNSKDAEIGVRARGMGPSNLR